MTEILTPYTVSPPLHLPHMACMLGWETLRPGTPAFTDPEGYVVCARCADHCVTCTSPDHDHPRYAYAAQREELKP